MRTVNIHEAKTHLSRLIREALEGEDIVIAKNGVPVVKLVVVEAQKPARQLGFLEGRMAMSDDFDEPLEDFEAYR